MARLRFNAFLAGMVTLASTVHAAAEGKEVVPCAINDKQTVSAPDASHLGGFLGDRLDANAANRLVTMDESRLLDGFRHRPGRQAWEGEHVGKWLHETALAWDYTQDSRLRDKMDRVVTELGKWQLEDGYLGTYLPDQRWTEWDVWAHKYDIIGLLTYYQFTGNTNALGISRRCADLLCRTFGPEPGQRDILKAGWHMGMAPTSVLEPMVLLYRYTGDPKYLDFCRYILASWETSDGPKIMSTLLSERRVDRVGNAKAYEMLSCLNGLLEMYRTTGDEQMLEVALIAWQDIVHKRLYITGASTHGEHFHDDYELPNSESKVAETCVTVTWIQFNAQLLRLTGEVRFADELERSVYNQLFGAQKPDGSAWGYYVEMEGRKPYSDQLSGHCCLSSGPRGVALIPTFALTTDDEGVVINFLTEGRSELTLPNGSSVTVEIETGYPAEGQVNLTLNTPTPESFAVKLRIPEWSSNVAVAINGREFQGPLHPGDYAALTRRWRSGDVIRMNVPVEPRMYVGEHGNLGKVAFAFGPLILAADDALNPEAPIGSFVIHNQVEFSTVMQPELYTVEDSENLYSVQAILTTNIHSHIADKPVSLRLVPFAEAGSTLHPYQVWLPLQEAQTTSSALPDTSPGAGAATGSQP